MGYREACTVWSQKAQPCLGWHRRARCNDLFLAESFFLLRRTGNREQDLPSANLAATSNHECRRAILARLVISCGALRLLRIIRRSLDHWILTCCRESPLSFIAFAIRSKLCNVPKPHQVLLVIINSCSKLFVSVRTVTGDLGGNATSLKGEFALGT